MIGLVATATWSRASVAELDSLQTGSQRVSKPLVAVQDLGPVQAADPRIRGVLGEKVYGNKRRNLSVGRAITVYVGKKRRPQRCVRATRG